MFWKNSLLVYTYLKMYSNKKRSKRQEGKISSGGTPFHSYRPEFVASMGQINFMTKKLFRRIIKM